MRKIVLVALLFVFSGTAFAQLSSPITLGLHAGLVSTKLDAEATSQMPSVDDIKERSENGMMMGAFLRVNFNKWYLQPELNYVKRKGKLNVGIEALNNILPTDITLHSLDIPVLLGYKIIKLPIFKLRAFAGPVASFKLDQSLNFGNITDETSNVVNDIKSADFKSAVWNGKVGVGVDVWKLTLDLDYEFGLTDVSSEFLKKNKMVNVTLGFKLF